MPSLLKSLRKSTVEKFIKSAKNHIRKTLECIMTLKSAFKKISAGNFALGKEKLKIIDELENQADHIRRSILVELPSSELDNRVREALAHLIKNIDRIANTANGASRIFVQIPDKYFKLIVGEDNIVMQMLEKTINAAELLVKMVDVLVDRGKKVDELNIKIQEAEHDVDKLLAKTYDGFLEMEDPIPPFVAIQISKGVNYIEAISDAIEDVADYIKILTIET
ncbi:MAG: DUF47 domain-containing protein [Promethearchaeota archaeon]